MTNTKGRPYQVMPPLTADEYAELAESIRAHGVQIPITVDEAGNIIDGYNRAAIAAQLGVECPRAVRAGLTEEAKRGLAYELNTNRRHLSREQKRALVAASLRSDPGLSDREHARRCGVTHPTVASVRRELAGGKTFHPDDEDDEAWLARKLAEAEAERDANGRRRFKIPDTIEAVDGLCAELFADRERMTRIVYERALAAVRADTTAPQAARNAYEFGLRIREQVRAARTAFDGSGAESVEEFAERSGLPVELLVESIDPQGDLVAYAAEVLAELGADLVAPSD
jgi:ParB-like chromosome segregation protein Spo0J